MFKLFPIYMLFFFVAFPILLVLSRTTCAFPKASATAKAFWRVRSRLLCVTLEIMDKFCIQLALQVKRLTIVSAKVKKQQKMIMKHVDRNSWSHIYTHEMQNFLKLKQSFNHTQNFLENKRKQHIDTLYFRPEKSSLDSRAVNWASQTELPLTLNTDLISLS